MKFEDKHTALRDLELGDIFLTKGGTILSYMDRYDNDEHLLFHIKKSELFVVPHGGFPSFKQIID